MGAYIVSLEFERAGFAGGKLSQNIFLLGGRCGEKEAA